MTENENEIKKTAKQEPANPPKTKIGFLTWAIMLSIIATLSSSGFVLGRIMAKSSSIVKEETAEEKTVEPEHASKEESETVPEQNTGESWYYNDLESVIVNPDEPGATRFVRVGLILEISKELSHENAKQLILAKNPLLINWLNLYFKSLSLDQMENERDMKRILSQICEGFNQILFPDAKPQIKSVLIREFNIQ